MPVFQKSPLAMLVMCLSHASVASSATTIEPEQPVKSAAKADQRSLETMLIIGDGSRADTLPGSAYVVSQEELQRFEYSDIHRVLQNVPGVYVLQEEGYGLRPNIGIRGAQASRSEKITLMEDGVLIAPAPYSGPSAYYFPTTARMSKVEVLKGPETLKYGPNSVGGAVNLVATPIPPEDGGELLLEAGENAEYRMHLNYGANAETYGWLLETHQHSADGFKDIDRSNRDTGFDKQDYLARWRVNTPVGAEQYQQFDIKLQYSTEVSNQSYQGLTDADFDADPNRRYGMSALDQMDNEHFGASANYFIEINDSVGFTATGYYNRFDRDWYKLDKPKDLITKANEEGDVDAIAQLHGVQDVLGIQIKHNAREYESRGLQFALDWRFETGIAKHEMEIGIRKHWDEVDRYQPFDNFNQINGELVYVNTSTPNAGNNRLQEAQALSSYLMDHISLGERWELTLVGRYEDIETSEKRYNDKGRADLDKASESSLGIFLPGLGANYKVDDSWSLLAGVHKGFVPAESNFHDDVDPEESVNWEAGFRYHKSAFSVEAIAFLSDYKNSIRNCSVASPCTTLGPDGNQATSGSESFGEAEVKGLELSLGYELSSQADFRFPVTLNYTYSDAEITEDSVDGDKLKGDNLPEIPENLLSLGFGVIHTSGWEANFNASYIDEMCMTYTCNRAGDKRFLKTDDLLVLDFASSYPLSQKTNVYLKLDNVFDEQAIVSRLPDGARANKPRTAYIGIRIAI
jgi:Fe(3+) dicitrate transport protein